MTEDGNANAIDGQGPAGSGTGVVEVPDWLHGEEFGELMADEGSANILKSYKTVDAAAKAIVEKERLLSSGLRIPEGTLSEEHLELLKPHVRRINGVPEKPEEYQMDRPENLPEGMDLSEELKMKIRAYGVEKGLPKGSIQGLYEMSLYAMAKEEQTQASTKAEAQETQKKETAALMQKYWGPNEFLRLKGEEGKTVGLIDQFVKSRAIDDAEYQSLIDELGETGLSNNPLLFKVFGDAARFYSIMEGDGSATQPEYAATTGAQKMSAEAINAQRFPNTPQSLGGGKPG